MTWLPGFRSKDPISQACWTTRVSPPAGGQSAGRRLDGRQSNVKRDHAVGRLGRARAAEMQRDFVDRKILFGRNFELHHGRGRDEQRCARLLDRHAWRLIGHGANLVLRVVATDEPFDVDQLEGIGARRVDLEGLLRIGRELEDESVGIQRAREQRSAADAHGGLGQSLGRAAGQLNAQPRRAFRLFSTRSIGQPV